MEETIYDTIIVGAGPAGMTAAIYASRRQMKTMIITKEIGGQLVWASEIENYPGFQHITNFELISKMQEQVSHLNVPIINEEVVRISQENEIFNVMSENKRYQAKTLILAMGLSPRRLAITGEQEFNGKGVSYCANCDGPLFRGKTIAVVGGGNSALDAAEMLSKLAAKVYLIHRNEKFRAFDVLVAKVKEKENIEMKLNAEIKEIKGEGRVTSIDILSKISQNIENVAVDGVFIEVGRIAHTDLVGDLVDRDEKMQIMVGENCETSHPGIFACGDVTQVPFKQITVATGEGTIAALSAYQYLQLKSGENANIILDRG